MLWAISALFFITPRNYVMLYVTEKCTPLNTSTALSFRIDSDGSRSTAIFSCANGYGMSGPQDITCASDGSWNMAQPTCCKFILTPLEYDFFS